MAGLIFCALSHDRDEKQKQTSQVLSNRSSSDLPVHSRTFGGQIGA
jgi:hypothetical protein